MIETLKEKILQNFETERGETEKPEWENQVDKWVESKIQKEQDKIIKSKYKGRDNKIIEDMKQDMQIRIQAEDVLKNKLKKVLPRVFKNFAVHGKPAVNKEGERKIAKRTDLDALTCLGLMKLTGWDIKRDNIKYIDFKKEDRLENTAHLDIGVYSGVAFLKEVEENLEAISLTEKDKITEISKDKNFWFNLGIIVDHHPNGSALSASSMLFKLLDKLGLFTNSERIKPWDKPKIKKMVEFLDIVDGFGFQAMGHPDHFPKSDRTILGLSRFISFDNLWTFFKFTDGDFTRELNDQELKDLGLIFTDKDGRYGKKGKIINRQEQQKKVIDTSNEKLTELEDKGHIIDSRFGKIIIDIDGQLNGGATVAQSIGAGYLNWYSKTKTLFMFANKELDNDLFSYGLKARKQLWVMPASEEETGLTLKNVIEKIGGKTKPGSELEKFLT